jgi:hypothetical protein
MRRYKMEIEKGIPKVGGSLPLTSGQDAGMQPTLLKVDRKKRRLAMAAALAVQQSVGILPQYGTRH